MGFRPSMSGSKVYTLSITICFLLKQMGVCVCGGYCGVGLVLFGCRGVCLRKRHRSDRMGPIVPSPATWEGPVWSLWGQRVKDQCHETLGGNKSREHCLSPRKQNQHELQKKAFLFLTSIPQVAVTLVPRGLLGLSLTEAPPTEVVTSAPDPEAQVERT